MQALYLIAYTLALQTTLAAYDVIPSHAHHHRVLSIQCTLVQRLLSLLPSHVGMHARHLLVGGFLAELLVGRGLLVQYGHNVIEYVC